MNGNPDKSMVRIWGRKIYEFCEARPQQELTHWLIRSSLGLANGSTYSNAVAFARKLATDDGNCISYCFDADGQDVLAFNPNDEQLAKAIARRGKAINGQVIGFVDILEWGSLNAQDPALRRYCAQLARAEAGAHAMMAAFTEMAEDTAVRIAAGS